MKLKWASMIVALALTGHAAEDGYRAFTAQDGRAIEARIVEYDSNRGRLKIERRGKGMMWVKPSVFSEADRAYIIEWISASSFMTERYLRVTAEKKRIGKGGVKKKLRTTEPWRYVLSFKNRYKKPFEGLRMEYKVYIKRHGTGSHGDSVRLESGEVEIGTIDATAEETAATHGVGLVTEYRLQMDAYTTSSGSTRYDESKAKVSEEKLFGLWVRVYGPEVGGAHLVRDFMFPKDLDEKYAWPVRGASFVEQLREGDVSALKGDARRRALDSALENILEMNNEELLKEISNGLELVDLGDKELLTIAEAFRLAGSEELYVKWLLKRGERGVKRRHEIWVAMQAEVYASSPLERFHDGKRAEEFVLKLDLRERSNDQVRIAHLDLLARAYARQGRFGEAAETQREALELLSGWRLDHYEDSFEQRLGLYQQGKAYTCGEDDVRLFGFSWYVDGERKLPSGEYSPSDYIPFLMRQSIGNSAVLKRK